jgi:uncharacterized membrane protein
MVEEMNEAGSFDSQDIDNNKVMAILAYILFLIPMLAAGSSPYAKYHTNQGLVLFLFAVIMSVVSTVIPVIGWLIIGPLGSLFCLVLFVMGIINAATGKAKPLPLIGGITLLK